MESDTKSVEQLEVVVEDISNLVDVGTEVGFHVQLVEADMEIAEHLVVDDQVAVGGELCIAKHLVMSNEIAGIVSLACFNGDLHVATNVEFVVASVDSLVVDVDEDLLMKHYVQFILGSEHSNWMIEILVFDRWMQMWRICMLVYCP